MDYRVFIWKIKVTASETGAPPGKKKAYFRWLILGRSLGLSLCGTGLLPNINIRLTLRDTDSIGTNVNRDALCCIEQRMSNVNGSSNGICVSTFIFECLPVPQSSNAPTNISHLGGGLRSRLTPTALMYDGYIHSYGSRPPGRIPAMLMKKSCYHVILFWIFAAWPVW